MKPLSSSKTTKRIVLAVDSGSFATGFLVTMEISDAGKAPHQIIQGRLPSGPRLPQLYDDWRSLYLQLEQQRIIVPPAQITNESAWESCRGKATEFTQAMERWLNRPEILKLQMQFQAAVSPHESAQLILKTEDPLLLRLPWHRWDLFSHYPQLGLALNSFYVPAVSAPMGSPVQILAVFGHDHGLEIEGDRQLLQQLVGAKITFLDQPNRKQLNEMLWKQPWDILFFAGHSRSEADCQNGQIQINDEDSLFLSDLDKGLQTAVQRGLKLAIFNSCDGLGLAQGLVKFKIPYTVVMREPVPDLVAQTFLRYFLETFVKGEPLHLALRTAREKLEGCEDKYPCASWLPVICQNPSAPVLHWPQSFPVRKVGIGVGVVALTVLAVGFLSVWPRSGPQIKRDVLTPSVSAQHLTDAPATSLANSAIPMDERFSLGERVLITATENPSTKQEATQAFLRGDYEGAIAQFKSTLEYAPNDPETRIYLNNAKAAQSGHWIRIAASVPISGNLNIAQERLRGIAQAQDDYNRTAQTQGTPLLQIQIANDDNSAEVGERIAERLVQDHKILAVIGHSASTVSLAAGKIYQKEGLVMISPTSGATELSNLGNYIFPLKARQLGGDESNWRTALSDDAIQAYDATQAIIKGLQGLQGDHLTMRTGLQQALSKLLGQIQPDPQSGFGYRFMPVPK